jgi:hypothetical protein
MQAREDMTNNEQPSEVNSSTPQACGLIPRKDVSAFAGDAKAKPGNQQKEGRRSGCWQSFHRCIPGNAAR